MGLLEAKDQATAEHSRNVARLALQLGASCGLKKTELAELELGALLHDADKLNVPDDIFDKLRRGAPLSEEDLRILREHASLEGEIPFVKEMPHVVRDCQQLHHENYNGSGTPHGLKEDQIPLSVRIVQVADTFDALTLNLPGRRGQSRHEALLSLKDYAGTILDPHLVAQFIELIRSPSAYPEPPERSSKQAARLPRQGGHKEP